MKKYTWVNPLIKFVITALLLWTLYQQVFAQENIAEIWQQFKTRFQFPNLWWLIAVVVLVPFNWGLETQKWRLLIQNFCPLPFFTSYKAILAGLTISLFTPNRIGEYGGRILMVPPEHNWKAVIATLVGSMSQLMILLSVGLLGAVWFSLHFLSPEPYILRSVLALGIILIAVLFICFFNIDLLIPMVKRLPYSDYLKPYFKHVQILRNYSTPLLARVLAVSFLRYATYVFQYYLLLNFFDISIPLMTGMAGVATIYLLQTSIPLPPIMGLLARGEFALFVWGFFDASEIAILSTTFGLFLINLSIPALIGLLIIMQTNVVKNLF